MTTLKTGNAPQAAQCCAPLPKLYARVNPISDDVLNYLIAAGPDDLVDLWTIQSQVAVGVLKSKRDLIADDAAVFPANSELARCAWKRSAYCWMREQMTLDFARRGQGYAGIWPIWAWATIPTISNSSEEVLHMQIPRRTIQFSWHFLWNRLLQSMQDIECVGHLTPSSSAYFAIDQDDLDKTCPNGRVPLSNVCETSWPRMFCLDLGRSPLYQAHRILQATIPCIPWQSIVW